MSEKLVKCKTCEKEISTDAKSCPHCGDPDPTSENKKTLKSCLGCFAVLVIGSMIFSTIMVLIDENKNKTSSSEKEIPQGSEKIAELPLDAKEFINNFNESMKTLDSNRNIKARIKDEDDNGSQLTMQVETNNQHIGMVLSANRQNRILRSATLIATGDGSSKSGVDIIFGLAAFVMAFEDPLMPVNERKGVVKDLGVTDNRLIDQGKVRFERKGIKYSVIFYESTGTWLTATPT
ncbi:MAG: hypothetical protein K9L23_13045 [Desulfotignum sp.]|nr:hypothetical protein [Desulfotignum sp.]MCF8125532.1 hypothetical protein [Desulfotignum sp.]